MQLLHPLSSDLAWAQEGQKGRGCPGARAGTARCHIPAGREGAGWQWLPQWMLLTLGMPKEFPHLPAPEAGGEAVGLAAAQSALDPAPVEPGERP